MTSDGRPYSRFTKALARGHPSQVRAAAADLPQLGLDDALAVTLLLLDSEPESYPRAAAKWAGRLGLERPVTLADLQLATAALCALVDGSPRAGAEALLELCERYDVRGADRRVTTWLQRHGLD
jgi:hypothetical protein